MIEYIDTILVDVIKALPVLIIMRFVFEYLRGVLFSDV